MIIITIKILSIAVLMLSATEMYSKRTKNCIKLGLSLKVSALAYARQISQLRFEQGFGAGEVVEAFNSMGEIIRKNLNVHPGLKGMERAIYDEISLMFKLMADEIEGTFEQITRAKSSLLNNH